MTVDRSGACEPNQQPSEDENSPQKVGSPPVRIAPATADDIDPIADLWVALAKSQRTFGSQLRAAENRETVRDWVARGVVTGELLVAKAEELGTEGPIVGFVGFSLDHGSLDWDQTRGTVDNLYVVPARRGEGIGSALLVAAEAALREAGAASVALEAMAANEQAQTFYQDHDYDQHRVVFHKSLDDDQPPE